MEPPSHVRPFGALRIQSHSAACGLDWSIPEIRSPHTEPSPANVMHAMLQPVLNTTRTAQDQRCLLSLNRGVKACLVPNI